MGYKVIGKSSTSKGTCVVHTTHVRIDDAKAIIEDVFKKISDTSWVEKLNNPAAKISYKHAADITIQHLSDNIFSKTHDALTEDVGEYVVSVYAIDTLAEEYKHYVFPISELWKEKISSNPSFDFHSKLGCETLLFGEAKFSGKGNPHGLAIGQIVKFIKQGKDKMDLDKLERFVGLFPVKRFESGFKAYCAAFSVNGKNLERILKNATNSKKLKDLLQYKEIYLIGVEFTK